MVPRYLKTAEQASILYIMTHTQQSSQTAEYQPQVRTALGLEMCDLQAGKTTLCAASHYFSDMDATEIPSSNCQ